MALGRVGESVMRKEATVVKRITVLVAITLVALAALSASASVADPSEYGLSSVSASESTYRAGAHPDFTTSISLTTNSEGAAFARTKDLSVALPPGLIGLPDAFPQCTNVQFQQFACPLDSQVGITRVDVENHFPITEPIFLLKPPTDDVVARLGFVAFFLPTRIDISVRSNGDYGVTASLNNLAADTDILSATTTLWGVPSSSVHDTERLTSLEALSPGFPFPTPRRSGVGPAPFMTNPTRCGVPRQISFETDSYQLPGVFSKASVALPEISGCGGLSFEPGLSVTPTTREAAAPSGLDVDLTIPQNEEVQGVATSQLRAAAVTLPEGMTLAPGAADGLAACSAAEVRYEKLEPASCPEASKIGTAEFDVPALPRTVQGAVYQRTPEPGHLFRIWLVSDEFGVHVKIPGEINLNPTTGQVTSVFVDTPQVPVRELRLHFKGGPRGVLATPPSCGVDQTRYEFTPWSGTAPVVGDAPMRIDQGCDTGGFSPGLSAGATNPTAGAFSPFALSLRRESGEQNLAGLDVSMPPGVLAKLAGVGVCDDGAAATGSCPASSLVGSMMVAAGPGPNPLWVPQPGKEPTAVYLAGPYKGAPYSLVVKVPARAGPFDLGTVVVRAAIRVNPETAEVSVESDPLPQILEGVPVSYRTVHVDVSRPDFTLNPTSCRPMSVNVLATSVQGVGAALSSRFQVGSCASLGFKPALSMQLTGKTNRGAHPRFRAVLKARRGDANIARAQVALPHSEFLDNAHIKTVCTRVQFAAENCPARSIYGHARAVSPLLDEPLEGPVYLRSSSHKLPDLVAALRGQIDIDLDGRIDSVKGGIRTTFEAVPDAPVTKFVLTMQGGKKGLLVNSRNLCRAPSRARVQLEGQNGKVADQSPPLRNDCQKHPRKGAG